MSRKDLFISLFVGSVLMFVSIRDLFQKKGFKNTRR